MAHPFAQAGTALLDPWLVYDHPRVHWDPHPKQLEIVEDHTRHQVVCGGRRVGKSNYGGHRLVPLALMAENIADQLKAEGKRHEYWIVGPEYTDGEKEFRVFWNALQRLEIPMDKPGSYNLPMSGMMHVSLWGGAFQVHVKSAKDPDRLVGEELTGVIMAEAAKMKPIIWTKHIRPMLFDQRGWSLHTSTPEGRNHFYDMYIRGQKKTEKNWRSWRMPSWSNTKIFGDHPTNSADVFGLLDLMRDNPSLDPIDIAEAHKFVIHPEILDTMKDQTIEKFKQETCADFTEFVGRVFKDFDTKYHCGTLPFEPDWETFAAIDYGFKNPNVWLLGQLGPNEEINFLDEVYIQEYTPLEFAREIRRRGLNPANLTYIYPDPASPADTAVLEEELKVRSRSGTGGELKTRLDMIRKALKRGMLDSQHVYRNTPGEADRTWRPQIMFDWKCSRTIGDFEEYKYPEKKEDREEETSRDRFENPMKLKDHGPEAVGRFMASRFGELWLAGGAGHARGSRMGGSAKRTQPERGRTGKPERYSRVTAHEPDGYEYKSDEVRSYYDE